MSGFAQFQLVRWELGGEDAPLGVIDAIEADGRRARVEFDDGTRREFVVDEAQGLVRVQFHEGASVRVVGVDDVVGVVRAREPVGDVFFYTVEAGDQRHRFMESGLRPAVLTDPLARAREGEFASARSFNQRVAARRLQIADRFDEMSSLSNARIWVKDHQVSVVHRVVSGFPHRFLLADEVGLGKTIEAGLIIKELLARGVVSRVLVIVPSGLVSQWQAELRRKFNLAFALYQRDTVAALTADDPLANVWMARDQVVTSAKWASHSETRRAQIIDAEWDLVVFDEAHHVRRRLRANEQVEHQTNLYRLAAALADPDRGDVQSLLLLTATPMQLDRSELYSLVELLDPALFESLTEFGEHTARLSELSAVVRDVERWKTLKPVRRREISEDVSRWLEGEGGGLASEQEREQTVRALSALHRLSDVLIRNRKTEVGGFTKRHAVLWPVQLTVAEQAVYDGVEGYVRNGYALADETHNTALGFVMTTFRRLMASSSFALAQALMRRVQKLQEGAAPFDPDELEDEDLEERSIADDDSLGAALGATAGGATEEEVERLLSLVERLNGLKLDSKAAALRDGLAELEAEHGPNTKVLVFTQSRDTQRYLRDTVFPAAWTVGLFHGGLGPREKDAAVAAFQDGQGLQALISTEAGGEGRNLQFCHLLVNYDLPWNPMKVEQRIGRVDRIGQREDVRVFNLYARGTVEERMIEVLHRRIDLFKQTVGGLDPILGDVESDLKRLFKLTGEASSDAFADFEVDLEQRVKRARMRDRQLADLILDRRSLQREVVAELLGRERVVTNADVQAFVLAALRDLGARAIADDEVAGIFSLTLGDRFEQQFPRIAEEGLRRRITFQPSVALEHEDVEFLAFGHDLVDVLVERALQRRFGGSSGARTVFSDEVAPVSGYQFVSVLEFSGARPWQELLSIFVSDDGTIDAELGDWLLRRSALMLDEDPWAPSAQAGGEYARAEAIAEAHADHQLLDRLGTVTIANREHVEQARERAQRLHDHRRQAAERQVNALTERLDRMNQSDDPGQRQIIPAIRGRLRKAQLRLQRVDEDYERERDKLAQGGAVAPARRMLAVARVQIAPAPNELAAKAASALPEDLALHLTSRVGRHVNKTLEQFIEDVDQKLANVTKVAEIPAMRGRLDLHHACAAAHIISPLLSAGLRPDATAVAIAAAQYFLDSDDAVPDNAPDGYRDDFMVARAVAWALGREDLYAADRPLP